MTSGGRSREQTRQRLLDAAVDRFQRQGYDATTVREIANDAGVNAALVIRYFGSKEGLFTEIALVGAEFIEVFSGDRTTLGLRLAEHLTEKDADSPARLVFRSLGNPSIAARFEAEMHERYVAPLAKWLGGKDAQVRAGLIVSILNGAAMSIMVLEQRSLSVAKRRIVVAQLGAVLQRLIDGDARRESLIGS
jgi:AcrR family transcriptional regulator